MTHPSSSEVPTPDFRTLFESAPGLYLVLTPDLTIVAVSDAYLRATMTRREEILGRALFDVFPDNPDDQAATGVATLRASLERVLTQRRPDAMAVQKYDIRRPESEGGGFEERHWSPVNSPVLDEDGEVRYIIHRVEDVTEFVRLRKQGSEHHKITQELRTRAGLMEAEIYRRAQEIQEANRQLRELQGELELRVEARTADLLRANDELRRSEDQLRQAQKMEAVGRLAGGVAHDFNNMLTAIMGYSQLMRARLAPDDPARRDTEEIEKAATRSASLTRQLLAFSRQQVLEPKVLDLNLVVSEMDSMLRRLIGADIDLVSASTQGLGSVKADPGQIEQVILNLAVNARDAMPEGGKLTIETANLELDESYAQSHFGVRPGQYVMLAVSDSGCGMTAETRARIFEPFFTTKETGKGTGLGLSTVYGIVKQSEGHIEVYSEPGQGTVFKIYMPRVDEASEVGERSPAGTRLAGGPETVLLAEDEELVRQVIRQSLELNGYTVIEARNGAEALEICEATSGAIDLLITDIVMPELGGPELVRRLATLLRDVRVLYISGYTDRAMVHQGVLGPGRAFLQKPFTPETLLSKVREMLDDAGSQAA